MVTGGAVLMQLYQKRDTSELSCSVGRGKLMLLCFIVSSWIGTLQKISTQFTAANKWFGAVPDQVKPPQGGAEGHKRSNCDSKTAEPYLLSTAPYNINVGLCCINCRGRMCRL